MTSIDPPLSGTAADLIDWLNEVYPPRYPFRGEDPEIWHRAAGAREMIDGLIAIRNTINETTSD